MPARAASRRRRRIPAWLAELSTAARFLVFLVAATLAIRTLVVMPRSIPSESMMPGLVPGDYLLVWKWPFGWSRFSLPWAPPAPHGRLLGRPPARGDIVVFRAPGSRGDYVKRVIGLPGDTVAMRAGIPILNGRAVPRYRIADFVLPVNRADACRSIAPPPYGRTPNTEGDTEGRAICRLPRYRETLPGGRAYAVIDQGETMQDDMAPITVPAGHYFLLGDNRDLSEDSRFPVAAGGIGMVPAERLEGRAGPIFFSTGGGWRPSALRPERIGGSAG